MTKKKEVLISCPESQHIHDLTIRTEQIFRHLRKNSGMSIPMEKFIKWQQAHENMVIQYAEFLETLAVDIDKPDMYSDSIGVAHIKDKVFIKS